MRRNPEGWDKVDGGVIWSPPANQEESGDGGDNVTGWKSVDQIKREHGR
jgi:hypothetical protein